jgi:hypothetical protein
MSIEKEAEEFLKSRQKKTSGRKAPEDRTALRYYMGCALSGLLSTGGYNARPEEVLEEAAKYAELALQKEQELIGP